jgi:hypothetical protein
VRVTARRLAIVVLVAAAAAVATYYGLGLVLGLRDDPIRLEIGAVGNLVYLVVFPLAVVLVIVAGVLAIRSRRASRVEIVVLGIIGGQFVVMGLLAAAEAALDPTRYNIPETATLALIIATCGAVAAVVVVLAMPTLLVTVIVSTIRAPRTGGLP